MMTPAAGIWAAARTILEWSVDKLHDVHGALLQDDFILRAANHLGKERVDDVARQQQDNSLRNNLARCPARLVTQLLDRLFHPQARIFAHEAVVMDHPRNRRRGDPGNASNICDFRRV